MCGSVCNMFSNMVTELLLYFGSVSLYFKVLVAWKLHHDGR